ncbi:MAG: hypothetical protein [Namikivirus sakae]|uniref:Uncharacterized protein n=1 Tax=Bacteriophage sp. TaxID=38018 RepID=A0ABY5TS54_9VIRU|nr:MAG: hypothetical protein [Bacteriophage sp.]
MPRRKTQEPIEIDFNDPNMMDWINEMRNSQPSADERRKISDYRYYHRHKEERAEANREWREAHAEHYAEKQKEYHSKPKVLKKKREAARERYHTDSEWREKMLARQKARYHAMTPEQKAEYARKQTERARIRRAKAKAAKLEAETKQKDQS